jgi:hypothetical protein
MHDGWGRIFVNVTTSFGTMLIASSPTYKAALEDVQKAAGHRDPSTTKLYDQRGYNPERAASFLPRTDLWR